MKTFNVEPTDISPKILYNSGEHHFEIGGFSRMENVRMFYQDFFNWFEKNKADILTTITPSTKLHLDLKIIYFNSASLKCFLDILLNFKKLYSVTDGRGALYNIEIFWHFEEGDEDMIEIGEDYSDVVEIPFTFVQTKSNNW
jgi:hypothetical protein